MENELDNNRNCLYCGESLKGRQVKYCSQEHKNAINNVKNKRKNSIYKRVDKQLHVNHEVLKKYFEDSKGEDFISQRPLLREGFDSRFITGTMSNYETGETLFIVYNFAFIFNMKHNIKIFYNDEGFHFK